MNHYDILGVARDASPTQIKAAYREAQIKWHPDRNQGSAEAEENFKNASEAYAILSDPARRQIYDLGMTDRGFDPSVIDPSTLTEDVLIRGFVSLFGNFFDEKAPSFREHVRRAAQARAAKREQENPGASDKKKPKNGFSCSMCKDKGKILMTQGSFTISRKCPSCKL